MNTIPGAFPMPMPSALAPLMAGTSTDLREEAVFMLMRAAPPVRMTEGEARAVIDMLRPVHLLADTVLFEEGDAEDSDYLVLVLEGQLRVASGGGGQGDEMVITVIGPGALLGEMGVVDGGPRSATCTAITDVKIGILSREALLKLIETEPSAAARLTLVLSRGLAHRLREGNRRLRMVSQVTRALQSELNAVHAVNQRLLDAQR